MMTTASFTTSAALNPWGETPHTVRRPSPNPTPLARGAAVFTADEFCVLDRRPRGWVDVFNELERLKTLEEDWDGEGSSPPEHDVVNEAVLVARSLEQGKAIPPHRVHASVNGTVYFEWYLPRWYAELEVVGPGEVEVRYSQK